MTPTGSTPTGSTPTGSTPAGPTSAAPVLVAHGLTRRFADLVAVHGVDLRIGVGTVFGLLGPDGAGKSTLIKLLATVLRADSGDASVFGSSVRDAPRQVCARIGYMPQRFCLYPDLTVAENIDFFATVRGVRRADRRSRAARLLAGMGMAEFTDRRAGALSGGMKQKLMLACTLMHEPGLLLLDEPTTGVDPVSRREFWHILAELTAAGTTVLVATPYMDEAARCTHIAFMADGRLHARGTPAEVAGSVPGCLLEISGVPPRPVLAAVTGAAGVRGAHLYGDVVRVLYDAPEPVAVAAVTGLLDDPAGSARVRRIAMDMESAYAALATEWADPQSAAGVVES